MVLGWEISLQPPQLNSSANFVAQSSNDENAIGNTAAPNARKNESAIDVNSVRDIVLAVMITTFGLSVVKIIRDKS